MMGGEIKGWGCWKQCYERWNEPGSSRVPQAKLQSCTFKTQGRGPRISLLGQALFKRLWNIHDLSLLKHQAFKATLLLKADIVGGSVVASPFLGALPSNNSDYRALSQCLLTLGEKRSFFFLFEDHTLYKITGSYGNKSIDLQRSKSFSKSSFKKFSGT